MQDTARHGLESLNVNLGMQVFPAPVFAWQPEQVEPLDRHGGDHVALRPEYRFGKWGGERLSKLDPDHMGTGRDGSEPDRGRPHRDRHGAGGAVRRRSPAGA